MHPICDTSIVRPKGRRVSLASLWHAACWESLIDGNRPDQLCMFPQEDEVIKGIERRISFVTHIPEVNGEGLQILHYEDGQKYEAHHDFFHDKFNSRPENGGQRIATVLMYL